MQSHAYQPGAAYRVQANDSNHGPPVFAAGADSQKAAITIANAWREAPEHAGRTIEIVRQSKTRHGDPIRFRYNAQAAEWQAVSWNTDDANPRKERTRTHIV